MWWSKKDEDSSQKEKRSVLAQSLGGGPCGLGDPDDVTLRKVEANVLIPKKVRDKSRREKCPEEVRKFEACCKETGLLMVAKCRVENTEMFNCLEKWFKDDEFNLLCKNEYLKERSDYRRTGITRKMKEQMAAENLQ